MIESQEISLTKAAKKLRLKIPTAKAIITSYRKKGLIYRRKKELPAQRIQPLASDEVAVKQEES